jgi:hypothetical protein
LAAAAALPEAVKAQRRQIVTQRISGYQFGHQTTSHGPHVQTPHSVTGCQDKIVISWGTANNWEIVWGIRAQTTPDLGDLGVWKITEIPPRRRLYRSQSDLVQARVHP